MRFHELFAATDFVGSFCECCRKVSPTADPKLIAQMMAEYLHRAKDESDFRQWLATRDSLEIHVLFDVAKCLLTEQHEMERLKELHNEQFGTGELIQKRSDQLADFVTLIRDYLDEERKPPGMKNAPEE